MTSTCPSISQFSSFIFIMERVLNFKDIYREKKLVLLFYSNFNRKVYSSFSYFAINKFKKYIFFYSRKRKKKKNIFHFYLHQVENLFIFKNESFTFNEVCSVYFILVFFFKNNFQQNQIGFKLD